jgi:hypothetical protein
MTLYVRSLIREKTRQYSWIVLIMIISICILWHDDMIRELIFQLFLNLSNSRNIFPGDLGSLDACLPSKKLKNLWNISENSLNWSCTMIFSESLWITLNLLGLPKQRSSDPHLKGLRTLIWKHYESKRNKAKEWIVFYSISHIVYSSADTLPLFILYSFSTASSCIHGT